jgi:GT2 family glycosyltransferase/glycosyltransferase involved in cell wall biosynthesis
MADGTLGTRQAVIRKARGRVSVSAIADVQDAPVQAEKPAAPEGHADDLFIEELYVALNPDVVEAIRRGEHKTAWDHWLSGGREETQAGIRPALQDTERYYSDSERRPVPESESQFLDAESYLYLNPDVRTAVGDNPAEARKHWLMHGRFEQRRAPGIAPFRTRHVDFARMGLRDFGLNVFGPFLAKTGLGTACRNMLAAIKETRIPFEVWNFDTSLGPARLADVDTSRRPNFNTNIIFANADQIDHIFAACPEGFFDDAYTIAVWQWELASFRPDWFPAFGAVDEVWTNSSFQVSAIRAVSPVPVVKIHLPIISSVRQPTLSRADLNIAEDAFVFLLPFDVGSTIARKNPMAGVLAFKAAFGDRKDVVLIVKYQAPHHDKEFGVPLSRLTVGVPNIKVIAQTYTPEEMASLRLLSDALVSPHRSEGFGLNIGEFMALGKSIIATNYSGNTDFFDETTGYPVSYTLTEISRNTGPYLAGYVWAEPNHDSLVENMVAVVERQDEARRKNDRAKRRIAQDFSPARVAWDIITRLRQVGLDQTLPPYTRWIGKTSTIASPSPLRPFMGGASPRAPNLERPPSFSIVMPVYNVGGPLLERCILSVLNQTYPFWELCIANDASTAADTLAVLNLFRGRTPFIKITDLAKNKGIAGASNAAAGLATGQYITFLDNDDELTSNALEIIAGALNEHQDLDCLYTDETKIDPDGTEIEHFYKPDWSPEHLESVMYVLHMLVVRKKLFFDVGQFREAYDGAQDYDLMLRLSRATAQIGHVPQALYRWRAIPGSAARTIDAKPKALEAGFRALADHVAAKYGADGRVEPGLLAGTFRVRRQVAETQAVSLMILTNNASCELPGRGRICMVENFVDSIIRLTSFPNYQINVVDNSSLSKSQEAAFQARGVRVLNYEFTGGFNYAAKANFAVRQARTELLVLLNDDMEVISPDWLTALIEYAQQPDIGAVGGRLLHEDGTLQHAGAVVGLNGSVGHVYHNVARDFVGYNGFTHIIRNYSAVTAACLATRKAVVMHAGGFDESFATDFNDIDLCLRMREAGYRIVYTPYCELYHFEGRSLPRETQNLRERALFCERWSNIVDRDPYYNENLTRVKLDFSRA